VLNDTVSGKRLELLRELLPAAPIMALITNPTSSFSEPEKKELQDAARSLGVQLEVLNAGHESEIGAAFTTLTQKGRWRTRRKRGCALYQMARPLRVFGGPSSSANHLSIS
jgi:hypothetical protein